MTRFPQVPEVMLYANRERAPRHELGSHEFVARRVADLLGGRFAGVLQRGETPIGQVYTVASTTLVDPMDAQRLRITGEDAFFGGLVTQPWMATKVISHRLIHAQAAAPPQWSSRFADRVAPVVLPGFSAFSLDDAEQAGRQLLGSGPVRLKPATATAGRGQVLVDDAMGLLDALQKLNIDELNQLGLVVEAHLEEVQTYSVGQVTIGRWQVAYCGTQYLTTDNRGEHVYGGSRLVAVRGGFNDLFKIGLSAPMHTAVRHAQMYDQAARENLPGLLASRRNYDVACGRDAAGQERCGVLEQSWRIGGASGAELAVLHAFAQNPQLQIARAACFEVYGQTSAIPDYAVRAFCGFDEEVGFISKFTIIEEYGNSQ